MDKHFQRHHQVPNIQQQQQQQQQQPPFPPPQYHQQTHFTQQYSHHAQQLLQHQQQNMYLQQQFTAQSRQEPLGQEGGAPNDQSQLSDKLISSRSWPKGKARPAPRTTGSVKEPSRSCHSTTNNDSIPPRSNTFCVTGGKGPRPTVNTFCVTGKAPTPAGQVSVMNPRPLHQSGGGLHQSGGGGGLHVIQQQRQDLPRLQKPSQRLMELISPFSEDMILNSGNALSSSYPFSTQTKQTWAVSAPQEGTGGQQQQRIPSDITTVNNNNNTAPGSGVQACSGIVQPIMIKPPLTQMQVPLRFDSSLPRSSSVSSPDNAVDLLFNENSRLRKELDACQKKITRLNQLEQDVTEMQSIQETLVKSAQRREQLDATMRQRLQYENSRLQQSNQRLKMELQSHQCETVCSGEAEQSLTRLREEFAEREKIIEKLMEENKELQTSKEVVENEVKQATAMIDEHRTHIDVLDTALANAQANVSKLEEEYRRKTHYAERVEKLQCALQALQGASEKRERLERRQRQQLEYELNEYKNTNGDDDTIQSLDSVNGKTSIQLQTIIQSKDDKISVLETEIAQLEQRLITEECTNISHSDDRPMMGKHSSSKSLINKENMFQRHSFHRDSIQLPHFHTPMTSSSQRHHRGSLRLANRSGSVDSIYLLKDYWSGSTGVNSGVNSHGLRWSSNVSLSTPNDDNIHVGMAISSYQNTTAQSKSTNPRSAKSASHLPPTAPPRTKSRSRPSSVRTSVCDETMIGNGASRDERLQQLKQQIENQDSILKKLQVQ